MKASVQASLPPMGLTSVDRRETDRSTTVDQVLQLLNQAVSECGYTLDAMQAVMHKDRSYINKVLQGDKPLSYAFVVALPDDVEKRFEALRAKSFGLIVVEPSTGTQAVENFVSGLVGLCGLKGAA
jgi:hypothetical protein